MNATQEEWRPIPGADPDYEVSDLGRVRSWRAWRGRDLPYVLKPRSHSGGYRLVSVGINGRRVNKTIHGLVLLAFVGPRPEGLEAAHWNGDKTDNRLCNLRWATHTENMTDQLRHGTRDWRRKGAGKLTAEDVRYIRANAAMGSGALAKHLGVVHGTVWSVLTGRTWVWLDANELADVGR